MLAHDPPRQRHAGKPHFPESTEEKAARIVDLVRRTARAPSALESLGIDKGGLPDPKVLQQRIATRLNSADAGETLPKEAKDVMAREFARSGHEVATQLQRDEMRLDDLDHSALTNLEAVIRVVGRPAWYVRQNIPQPQPEVAPTRDDEFWIVAIGNAGSKLRAICGRAGVVTRSDGGAPVPFGTAWMIGARTVITNAHVAKSLAFQDAALPANDARDRWRMQPGIKGAVDFAFEHDMPRSSPCELEDLLYVQTSENPDLAIFLLKESGTPLLPVIALDLQPRADWRNVNVFAVGHPIRDLQNDPNVAMVFGEIDGTKRFSPGTLTAVLGGTVLAHDCSTTNGSSGSPIVDFVSLKAVGLHYFGAPGARNESVLLAAYAEHPAIKKSVANAWS